MRTYLVRKYAPTSVTARVKANSLREAIKKSADLPDTAFTPDETKPAVQEEPVDFFDENEKLLAYLKHGLFVPETTPTDKEGRPTLEIKRTWAEIALREYAQLVGQDPLTPETLTDLLTDLAHLARNKAKTHALNFSTALRYAAFHYVHERENSDSLDRQAANAKASTHWGALD